MSSRASRIHFLQLLRDETRRSFHDVPARWRARYSGAWRAQRSGSIAELRDAMQQYVPRPVFDFLEGAACDEVTAERNRENFNRLVLRPRVLRGVDDIQTRTTVLGRPVDVPILAAPTGGGRLFHQEGEAAIARAIQASGSIYVLSAMASQTIEYVAREAPGPKWFQTYMWRDRGLVSDLLSRARREGYEALVLTVDTPRVGQRERDRRNGFTIPPRVTLRSLVAGARHPRWSARFVSSPAITLASIQNGKASLPIDLKHYQFDDAITWKDLEWLRGEWDAPFLLKGIMTSEDASLAAEMGVDGIIVSNHGGRQLDHVHAAIDALPEVIEASGDMEVLIDGGIRRGSDIVKALSLGARACLVGRSLLYGLGAAGEIGVRRALELLTQELELTMALMGRRTIEELDRSCIEVANPVDSFFNA